MKKSLAAGAVLLIVLCIGTWVGAQEADAAPPWSITFSHKSLDVITVPYRDGSARSFYYMLFTLKNGGKTDAPTGLHIKALVGSDPRKQKVMRALPYHDAEEYVRRMSRTPALKNIQAINAMKVLKAGESVQGIAVMGTFDREWDIATVTVSGLEPIGLSCRVRMFEGAGFTVAHRAYLRHNRAVLGKAGEEAEFTEAFVILRHDVIWRMVYNREGDEYAPQTDPIYLDTEGWDVVAKPAPAIVFKLEDPFPQ